MLQTRKAVMIIMLLRIILIAQIKVKLKKNSGTADSNLKKNIFFTRSNT